MSKFMSDNETSVPEAGAKNKIKAIVEITLVRDFKTSDDALVGVYNKVFNGTEEFTIETIHQHFEDLGVKPELIYRNIELEK